MKKFMLYLVLLLLNGCSGHNENHHFDIVKKEVSHLSSPSKRLSSYSNFLIQDMIVDAKILEKEDKTEVAKILESKMKEKISLLLEEWGSVTSTGSGTLLIVPDLHSLRIVGSGARFLIGGMAGDSKIDMNLKLIDKASGKEIGNPRINMSASGISGGWSVGGTDKNLLNYISDVSYQYLKDNY